MLSMTQKALLGLTVTLAAILTVFLVVPSWSYEVKLLTNPNARRITVRAGEPFNVTCQGSGDDEKKFSLLKWIGPKGNVIPEGIPGVQKGRNNSLILTFTTPKTDDSGVYKCSAVYASQHTLEIETNIVFYGPQPEFENDFENITAEEGSKTRIICKATGDNPITYDWYNQEEDRISEDATNPKFVSNQNIDGSFVSILTIQNVKSSDKGMYECTAKNSHGLTSKLYQLHVLPGSGKDNETSSLGIKVVNVTENSVKFRITANKPAGPIEVKYTEIRDSTEYRRKLIPLAGNLYEITDLLPSGLYSFQVNTESSSESNWSKVYNVTLLPKVPEVIFKNLEGGSVKLEWFRTVDDSMRSTIDKFEIKYFLVQMSRGNSWIPSNCAITVEIPSCSGSSHTISGLSQKAYYEIQLRTHTVSGYGKPYKQKVYM